MRLTRCGTVMDPNLCQWCQLPCLGSRGGWACKAELYFRGPRRVAGDFSEYCHSEELLGIASRSLPRGSPAAEQAFWKETEASLAMMVSPVRLVLEEGGNGDGERS